MYIIIMLLLSSQINVTSKSKDVSFHRDFFHCVSSLKLHDPLSLWWFCHALFSGHCFHAAVVEPAVVLISETSSARDVTDTRYISLISNTSLSSELHWMAVLF